MTPILCTFKSHSLFTLDIFLGHCDDCTLCIAVYRSPEPVKPDTPNLQQEQQELQAKILSILNGPGDKPAPKPPVPQARVMGNGAPGQGQAGMSSLINFDNPSVQKALDNLIQSGPNLLKNISSPQGVQGLPQQVKREAMAHQVGYGAPVSAAAQQHVQHMAPGQHPGLQAQRPMYAAAQVQPRAPQMQPGVRRPYWSVYRKSSCKFQSILDLIMSLVLKEIVCHLQHVTILSVVLHVQKKLLINVRLQCHFISLSL